MVISARERGRVKKAERIVWKLLTTLRALTSFSHREAHVVCNALEN